MKHLWTPWRMTYIKSDRQPFDGCVFCKKCDPETDELEHVIARSEYVYLTLNRYPYNNGHLMVVPYKHIQTQEDLTVESLTDMMVMVNYGLRALRTLYDPPAFNVGANIGAAAGAGIEEHYHFHVVPRWPGDANFISTVGQTRVIPDTLDNTYQQLKIIWREVIEGTGQ